MKLFLLFTLFTFNVEAYIPPSSMILNRLTENSGQGAYQVDQEIRFETSDSAEIIKESWTIENENAMKVTVKGTKDLEDKIHFQILYTGGLKWFAKGGQRESTAIPSEFLDRYFHFRSSENFGLNLSQWKIAPPQFWINKGRNAPESYLRLSRCADVVCWAYGSPTNEGQERKNPQLWIEQDQFVVRKIIFPGGAEISADQFGTYPKGLKLPKQKTVSWGSNVVSIQTTRVTSKTGKLDLQPSQLSTQSQFEIPDSHSAKSTIMEFYSRFR